MELFLFLGIPALLLLFYFGWFQLKYLFFFLLMLIPFSIEFPVTNSLATDFPDEIIMVMVSCLGIFYTVNKWQYLQKLLAHPLFFILAIWLAWIGISAVFSANPLVSFKYLLAKTWYTGAFVIAPFLVLKSKQDILMTARFLAIAMLAVLIIIFARHTTGSLRFSEVNSAVVPFFRNHVNYGALLVCCIPLFLAGLYLSKTKRQKTFMAISIFILLIALYFSYSRGAWLAMGTGAVAWWLIKRRLLFPAFIAAFLAFAISFLWIRSNDRYLALSNDFNKTIFHEDFGEHLIATYQLKDVSTAERIYRWVAGVRMVKDEALTGYGPNTFYDHYKNYALPAFRTWVSNNDDHSTVHNYYLLLAIEQGIPGLFLFLLLLGAALFYAQRVYHLTTDPFYRVTVITTTVILTMVMSLNFLSDLIETDKIGSVFFLCIAILVISSRVHSGHPSGHSPIN